MIFCENMLYLHVPKTAGMSLTQVLLKVCPRPTYYSHPDQDRRVAIPGVHEIDGVRHETLDEAASLVPDFGFPLTDFRVILAVIRNPYEIEVSRFAYYQKGYAWDSDHPARNHALAGDFRSFAIKTTPHGGHHRSIHRFFLLNGVQPANLRVARYEHLVPDVRQALDEAGISPPRLEVPHDNASTHEPWQTYYDPESELAVFSRYRWAFEAGYYERLELAGRLLRPTRARRPQELRQEIDVQDPTDTSVPLAGLHCRNPIFIIGSPRSGTSIIPRSLAQHPRLWTSRESGFLWVLFPQGVLDKAFAKAQAVGWTADLGVERPEFMAHVGLGLNVLLTGRSNGLRWIDQTPANTLIVSQLAELFPGARFLHMVRDGRKVIHSMQHFGRSAAGLRLTTEGRLPGWAGEFGASVRVWCNFVRMSLAFEDDHPERVLRIRLEDVVADPIPAFENLIEQLGEPPNTEPARYFSSHRINSSFDGVERKTDFAAAPPEPDPFSSWTVEQRQVFIDEGGEALLELLDYAPSSIAF